MFMATACQGDKPYIFLSYAHVDRKLADYVVDYLQGYNFNVWFDEGIRSGTPWEEVIADKISSTNCWMMVFLATQNSLASEWCRNELKYAKDEGKKFINVVIGNLTFPKWFRLSYSIYQFLYEKNFPNLEAMLDKLVEDLLYHELNPDKPTDTPKDTTKDTPKETSAVKPLPTPKAPEVAKDPKASTPFPESVSPYVAPKASLKPSPAKGLEFSIVNGTARVDRYKGTVTKVIIPATIIRDGKTYKVSSIGYKAFYECKKLTSITIPNSVTSIGEWAFRDCDNLTAINVDQNNSHYKSIDGNLYTKDGSTLIQYAVGKTATSFTIPDGVTTIGADAIWGCKNLTSISIPKGVKSIGESAFAYCENLTSITIPNSVTIIEPGAFVDCENLTIYCEAKSKPRKWHIGWNSHNRPVVWRCKSSKRSVAPKGPLKLISAKGLEFSIVDGTARVDRYKGTVTKVIIPATIIRDGKTYKVSSIGYKAFYECKKLTSITIPNSVTSIGEWAFYLCSSLTSITISDSVTSIGEWAFRYCDNLTAINVDQNNSHYKSIDGNLYTKDGSTLIQYAVGKTATSFTIPDGVTTIGADAIWGCKNLTSISIPKGVKSIGESAFAYCENLTSITIPNSVTTIGYMAFVWCVNLTIYCEAKSKPEGWDTDWNPTNLPVTWGYESSKRSVAPKETPAPSSTEGLQFSIVDGTARVDRYKGTDTKVIIPATIVRDGKTYKVTAIGKEAFWGCSSLTSITIPDGVTTIGQWAFDGCSSLTSIIIPDSVTTIGEMAFCDCKSLTSITIPKGVKSIGKEAFCCCSSLTSISIPKGVKSIGESAFELCSSLTSITIPKGVKSIGGSAFRCYKLTIYCEAKSKPRKWHTYWNPDNRPVVWGYKGE